MHKPNTIFVDTDVFIALAKVGDTNHEKAVTIVNKLVKKDIIFVTSNYVFLECVTVISQMIGHTAALRFITEMKFSDGMFSIKQIDENLDEQAIHIFREQTSKNTSFVDCANMAVVK